ncbi:LANO_0D05490g1_1 [Lachancea nothofagi CBS 11611]|uniref:LANO_0D05490g1_1 n=1 Tax=Lachancea nothofagi CBS 11611 TaxID=1266666 RepID=A0A1G4JGS8_9SACH|nr:LANO_0D05490g1_1 [Lachancea nothofagi CBS 11611]
MGGILSCCFGTRSSETEPLVQEAQKGYGSYGNEDDEALQRKIEQEEQKLLAREQELTEIVNNTNDKLIDISMMSNSGIVVQSHDLGEAISSEKINGGQDTRAARLQSAGASAVSESQRKAIKGLYSRFFENLGQQLHLDSADNLIVNL